MVADDRGSVGVGDCGAEEKLFPAVLCEDMPDASKSAAMAHYALLALDRPQRSVRLWWPESNR
jgi:hypothetical protein